MTPRNRDQTSVAEVLLQAGARTDAVTLKPVNEAAEASGLRRRFSDAEEMQSSFRSQRRRRGA